MKQNFDISCLMIGVKLRKPYINGDFVWAESNATSNQKLKSLKVVQNKAHKAKA